MHLRHGMSDDFDQSSEDSGLRCRDPSLTVQSQAEEADINVIVRRFGVTGVLPEGVRAPVYQDFLHVFDFQSAMNAVRGAQESFDKMPADVRKRFANDTQQFVVFCSDPGNIDELRKLGLAIPAVVPAHPGNPTSEVAKDE